jgi:oligopeptide transport system substrate-binding protein
MRKLIFSCHPAVFVKCLPQMMIRWFLIAGIAGQLMACQKESQVDRASREGILLIGNSADPKSLDLHIVSGVLESNIMRALFEGVVQFDAKEDLAAPLGAATELTPDETYTVWTVKLRPDAKWSDGEPLTAEDFAFSYERILRPNLLAKYADMLFFLKGAEAFNKGDTTDFSTVGIEVIDEHTFKLTLRGPTPYFRELLKHYTWYPVPKHVVLKHGAIDMIGNRWSKPENLVGNGPFRIKSYLRNDHIEVERNPHYWDAANVKLNGIRFLPIINPFTEARMFRDGQLHITYSATPEIVDLMAKEAPHMLRQEPYLGTDFYRFNTKRKPFDDMRVRQALSLSIDRDGLQNSVYRGYLTAYGMTPPMQGYEPPRGVAFDPERARKLLAEAGFPGGAGFPRKKLLISSSNTTLATAVQAMWRKELGVEVEIESKEWTAYLAATQEMEYDIVSAGWIGDYIDPLTFLEMWMPGNGNNNTGWENEEFNQLLQKSFKETNPAERYRQLFAAEEILLREAPIAPIAWRGKNYLLHPSVKGWHPLLLDCHPYNPVQLVPQK